MGPGRRAPAAGSGLVLSVLGASQFLMTLDSSVMNVSLADIADDIGTPITGIQVAITLYTLVMATLMLTGGKVGSILGRRRTLGIGLVVYGLGSFTTALAPNLAILMIGWCLLEGVGAALIMPAVVALVASNFTPERRAAAYGLIAAAGAIAIAAGPIIGGAVTTFGSWRYVFAAEVVLVLGILTVLRRVVDAPPKATPLDIVGSALSIVSLGLIVFGVLRTSEWGWVTARPGKPTLLGTSPVIWLIGVGLVVLFAFFSWQSRLEARGGEPLLSPQLLRTGQLVDGLSMFFAQFMVQAGVFFVIPLFLSVVLDLSALQTGLRLFPLSVALLVVAAGVPKLAAKASPRRVVQVGWIAIILGIAILVGGMRPGANAGLVALPMLLLGCGLGALASQLGALTVSAVSASKSAEVGGLQNTVTNLGASLGTALIGSVLISALGAAVASGLQNNPDVPPRVAQEAPTRLAAGVPFLSDTQLAAALDDAGVQQQQAIIDVNDSARYDALRVALALSGLLAGGALFLTRRLPDRPASSDLPAEAE